jgi:DNA-binding transcriptional ArsR family regulator
MATLRSKRNEAVFRVIADPTRREILALLRGRRLTVNDIAGNFRSSRPAISKHLRLLRSVGLVKTERQGTARICRLDPEPLRIVDAWLKDYRQFWRESLRSLKRYVEDEQ